MSIVLLTGSTGLVGSESVKFFCKKGFDVIVVDNNFRKFFFGKDGDTLWIKNKLKKDFKNYKHFDIDIRNLTRLNNLFRNYKKNTADFVERTTLTERMRRARALNARPSDIGITQYTWKTFAVESPRCSKKK